MSSGDYIGAENYLQHAEHYARIINIKNERNSNGNSLENKKDLKNNEISETQHEDFTHNDRPLVPSRLEGMFYIVYTVYIYNNKICEVLIIVYQNFQCPFRFIRKTKQRKWKLFH